MGKVDIKTEVKSKRHRIVVSEYDPQDERGTKPVCLSCGERVYQTQRRNGWTHDPSRFL